MDYRVLTREDQERRENELVAPYAMRSTQSRGRDHETDLDPLRTEFQRDRDRIIHCTAFRKLEYKTQVFIITEGDYYRTRITHTLEVAQIARTLARALGLNADLAEAIALAHDLGHTPFGHAGEEAMRRMMEDEGGFEHNIQGLRVVERLEERYPGVPGLNLTYEVREGIIKHDTAYDSPTCDPRFRPSESATLESQICDLADEVAYNNADLDDALKMGLIEIEDLKDIGWVWEKFAEGRTMAGFTAREKFVKYKALGGMYDMHVHDIVNETQRRLEAAKIRSLEDVRAHKERLADFSDGFKAMLSPLKSFLFQRVYRHPNTVRMATKAQKFIEEMFTLYLKHPDQLPWKYQARIKEEGTKRVICDYISGMTDRYLMEEYQRAFAPQITI